VREVFEEKEIKKIEDDILDQILELQIKIARAGEQERLCWWRVDATDSYGGGDFFLRLVDSISGLCAVEAAIEGAKMLERQKLSEAGIGYEVITLFHPEFNVKMQINERWMHIKNNPDDVPASIRLLLDHELKFDKQALTKELEGYPKPSYERSPFGRKMRGNLSEDPLMQMRQLASLLPPLEIAGFTKQNRYFRYRCNCPMPPTLTNWIGQWNITMLTS